MSGHAAMAFVLATSLADDMHNTWASIGLYTFATGTAWSRLNDNRHWPSDVVGGAVLGFTVSKMMSNRWEVLDFIRRDSCRNSPTPLPDLSYSHRSAAGPTPEWRWRRRQNS